MTTKSPTTEDKLLSTLKRHNPARVRVTHGEDVREIAVPTRRRKWGTVIAAIEGRAWSSCELLDKSGGVLAYVENDSLAGELSDLGETYEGTRGELRLGERIAALAIRSMRDAISFRDRETAQLLQAQGAVVREMAEGVRAIADVYREQMQVRQESAETATEAAVAAATANGSQVKELLEAMPLILQAVPMLRGLLASGAPASAPNGARKA